MNLQTSLVLILISSVLSLQPGHARASPCGTGCMVSTPSVQHMEEVLNDLVDESQRPVQVDQNETTGVLTITLGDGTQFSIETIGMALGHQNMHNRQVSQSDDGTLYLRSQSGLQIRIRAAIHQEEEVIGAMHGLGWSDFFWFDGGIEASSPAGDRLCLAPDMQISAEPATGETQVDTNSDGSVVVIFGDGIVQRLHGCAHDQFQLRDHVRSLTQQTFVMDSDGTFTLNLDDEVVRFRLDPILQESGILDQPGIFSDEGGTYIRYRNGLEQDIVILN